MSAAVQIRSFARIHETNLRKQGIVPLTLVEPTDSDHAEQDDRVSVTGSYALEPGHPVTAEIKTPGGHVETIQTRCTMTREEIAWFSAGSAPPARQPVNPATGAPAALEMRR